jgi:HD-GYP domain-containing protein (c-di-GMP phosphodiesterase class II)
MNSFSLDRVPPSSFFSKPVYLDSKFIIATPEMPFNTELVKMISEWGFAEVLSDGEPSENYVPTGGVQPASDSTADDVGMGGHIKPGELGKIKQAEVFCISFEKYVRTLFALLPIRNDLDFNAVAEKVKPVCDIVREDRRYLMRTQWLTSQPQQDENHLISHSVRSTIIAIIIGTYLKLQPHRLIELGVAALLHEIGMIKLPAQIYMGKGALNDQEKKLISAHPILGYNLLKSYNFPLVVCLAALEHHERENGTGYPQRKTGDKISLYAKIIAVACSYEAILSSRPHKDAKDGHAGIMELMKNEGKQYDDTIIRALVYSLSVYPIGLYVMLSSGKKGQVIDVNPENPRYPFVQIFGEPLPDGKNKTVQTSSSGINITRPLTPEEAKDLQ